MATATPHGDLCSPAVYRPGDRKTCFAHYHLTVEEYGLWTHARQLAHESGIFYFDGRKIAQRFGKTGKNTIYRIGNNLIRKGWFVIIRRSKRLKNGMFSPGEYRPLSHEEWVARYPGTCLESNTPIESTSPETGTGEDVTSPGNGIDLSRNRERPVLESGHNVKGLNRKGEYNGEGDTPSLDSKSHADEEKDRSRVRASSKKAPSPKHPVKSSKVMSAAQDVARLQAEILRIPLDGGRTFQINGKTNATIHHELANGRSAALIFAAAQRIGGTLSDRDRIPGLTLADNLAATIVAIEMEQADAFEQQKRKETAAMEKKLEKRRYELIRAILIQQEEQVGREYQAWRLEHPDSSPEGFFPDEFHPLVFERYQLVESLKKREDIYESKRLCDLRGESGESQTILAGVEAQLAAEGFCTTIRTS
jgi:hypothetical protein